jgi:hypothetical protein
MLLSRIRRLPESAAIRRIVVGTLVYNLLAFVWGEHKERLLLGAGKRNAWR